MIPLKIESKDGYLNMKDLPHNCIFNKVTCGCGGTTIVLDNDQNYVIAVPTTELILNKLYPVYDYNNNPYIYQSDNKDAGLSPVRNLFGLYGTFSLTLKGELKRYLQQDGVKKIMCTYDKLPYLSKYINTKGYRLLIDEYHSLLKSYAFRDKAINGVFDSFQDYKSYCFMSATPILPDYKPNILKNTPVYYADWKHVEKLKIVPYKTNKPYNAMANIIEKYKKDGYIIRNGIKSTQAFIFLNSVTDIKSILDHTQLKNNECRIICADNDRNKGVLESYTISRSVDEPRMFNFITSKSFEGADYYSKDGICYIVSNGHNKHTLLDISTDVPQIAGRIRTLDNPFRNFIVHIFSNSYSKQNIDFEKVKKSFEEELNIAQKRVDLYNEKFDFSMKKQQIIELKKQSNSCYITYDKDADKFIVNDMLVKHELYYYRIHNIIYKDGISLNAAYKDNNIQASKIEWEKIDEDVICSLMKKPTFQEVFNRYIELKDNVFLINNTEIVEIEKKYPFIKDALNKLGVDTIKSMKYIQKDIKAKLLSMNQEKKCDDKIFLYLKDEFSYGVFVKRDKILKHLNQASTALSVEADIKIKDLKKWFDFDAVRQRNGKDVIYGYIFKAPKIIYSK
ncbi:hypothetical protein [Dysgonomonas sp. 520]|uniref:hypothetical protein n=1 Tax=Dysgonomonas sp. 520 TaxID=2302931 RepID=UPI00162A4869|nr:hypothetical protein [Dysgonomonas sp. 520]